MTALVSLVKFKMGGVLWRQLRLCSSFEGHVRNEKKMRAQTIELVLEIKFQVGGTTCSLSAHAPPRYAQTIGMVLGLKFEVGGTAC